MTTTFGDTLKAWRGRRRMSQMALALAADVSTRHVSYIETGKAAPSRAMVLRLADAMSVPMHARNDWLTSAGFAPVFQRRELASDDLRPFMAALERMLARHDPYPGWVLDHDWKIIRCNRTGEQLLSRLGIAVGESLIKAMIADPSRGGAILNWQEAAAHLAARLGSEARRRGDEETAKATKSLAAQSPPGEVDLPVAPAVTTRISLDGVTLELVSIQAVFNTASDLSLADLRTELFYPVDAVSEQALETVFGRTSASGAKTAGGAADRAPRAST